MADLHAPEGAVVRSKPPLEEFPLLEKLAFVGAHEQPENSALSLFPKAPGKDR